MADSRHMQASEESRYAALRRLGSRAHQVRAAARATDHFIALGIQEDRDTGAWLMSAAVTIAADLADEIDNMARSLRQGSVEPAFMQVVQQLRVRAHQLHAAARAADHFLEQETREDADTGVWLIAFARGLADKLATEMDDAVGRSMRLPGESIAEDHDALLQRRLKQALQPAGDLA